MILSCAAVLSPASAQTGAGVEAGKTGRQWSPALRKKVAERMVALRAQASAPVEPMFDHFAKSWTIESSDCSLVKSQVKGTGFKGHTVWVTMNDDGTFHLQIRTEASGTAVDAGGNKLLWTYNAVAELDTPDPTADTPIVTGSGPSTFQLIPLSADGTGYTATGYVQADTPTPIDSKLPVISNAPVGCEPF